MKALLATLLLPLTVLASPHKDITHDVPLYVPSYAPQEWVHKMEHTPSEETFITTQSGEKVSVLTGTHKNDKSKMMIEFNMIAHDYFTSENVGHIAILVGGNLYSDGTNSGQGIVIGNVTGYDKGDGVCVGNKRINSVSVETFFPHGNCVYKDDIGITFRNNVIYNIRVIVDKVNNTVTTDIEDEYGNGSSNTVKTYYNDIARHGDTWAITEVMGTHSWTVMLSSPKVSSW